MDTLLEIHSIVRWLIVVVGAVAAIKFVVGWLRETPFSGMDRGLSSGFSGLIDLQVVLGLAFLIWSGVTGAGFPRVRLEHTFIMIIAAVVAHLPARWKEASDKIRFRNSFLAVVGTLLLIVAGVALLPGGWTR